MSRKVPPPLALVYHAVGDVSLKRDPHGLFVRVEDLRRHIDRLLSWEYRPVTFGDLSRRLEEDDARGCVALTFDDGYVDNLEMLLPVLEDYSIPATVFVVSGWLGQVHPVTPWTRVLTADEVAELSYGGVEIGSHTRSHPDLSRLSYGEVLAEFRESKRDLEQITDRPVDVAAYPFGIVSPDAIAACRDAGYRAAGRTSGEGHWSLPHELPRQDMDGWSSTIGFWLKKHDRYEGLMRYRTARAVRHLNRSVRSAIR